MKISGSIVLASVREITGIVPLDGRFSVQLLSTNLSGETTLNLYLSADGTNWDIAQEAGADIEDSIVDDVTKVLSFEADPAMYYKIVFAGATTGTVSYVKNY
jgi:hypothetical protein